MKPWLYILAAAALAAAMWLLLPPPDQAFAADGFKTLDLATDETGAGQTTKRARPGGSAVFQVTCSTSSGNTWPDSVDLEARVTDSHEWVTVAGSSSYTTDERDGAFWFAPGEEVRVTITDAAGSHSCTATLGFGTSTY